MEPHRRFAAKNKMVGFWHWSETGTGRIPEQSSTSRRNHSFLVDVFQSSVSPQVLHLQMIPVAPGMPLKLEVSELHSSTETCKRKHRLVSFAFIAFQWRRTSHGTEYTWERHLKSFPEQEQMMIETGDSKPSHLGLARRSRRSVGCAGTIPGSSERRTSPMDFAPVQTARRTLKYDRANITCTHTGHSYHVTRAELTRDAGGRVVRPLSHVKTRDSVGADEIVLLVATVAHHRVDRVVVSRLASVHRDSRLPAPRGRCRRKLPLGYRPLREEVCSLSQGLPVQWLRETDLTVPKSCHLTNKCIQGSGLPFRCSACNVPQSQHTHTSLFRHTQKQTEKQTVPRK